MKEPLVSFVIGGVQKGGTTALASFLKRHPMIMLPREKEAHVFDSPDFDESWSADYIDGLYGDHFDKPGFGALYGDATPIYCFHRAFIERIAAYNPRMRWVIVLRHPVERAVSQFQMERRRGDETWPLWPAMLLERWRLRGHENDFSARSPMRHHSYRSRGDYARQLDALYACFPAEQVLLLRNDLLASSPEAVLERVWEFLGVTSNVDHGEYERIFAGNYRPLRHNDVQFRLLSYLMAPVLRAARSKYGLDW